MEALTHQRCFNHGNREAAARCPECGRFFCRECVTEHDDRVLCSRCLSEMTGADSTEKPSAGILKSLFMLGSGVLVLWLVFYYLGLGLLEIPPSFHEGTIWQRLF
jgi:uncharacterized paraquat-inducible protein A